MLLQRACVLDKYIFVCLSLAFYYCECILKKLTSFPLFEPFINGTIYAGALISRAKVAAQELKIHAIFTVPLYSCANYVKLFSLLHVIAPTSNLIFCLIMERENLLDILSKDVSFKNYSKSKDAPSLLSYLCTLCFAYLGRNIWR